MANNSLTRRLFAAGSRYRPRGLTLAVLAVIAGLIVLANLSGEFTPRTLKQNTQTPGEFKFEVPKPDGEHLNAVGYEMNMSYGWPLPWRQYILIVYMGASAIGESHSTGRLIGNVAVWAMMMATPTAACEWLLRRYRPRVKFSLRTLMVAMGLAAALFAWLAAVRNRANLQDPIIEAVQAESGGIWIERRGPKWLEHLVADRYRRRIVGISLAVRETDEEEKRQGRQLIDELKRLPGLRYLSLTASRLTPELTAAVVELQRLETLEITVVEFTAESSAAFGRALRDMRRLRTLCVVPPYGISLAEPAELRSFLAAIGNQPRLEQLRLEGWEIDSQDISLLRGLINLKSLALHGIEPPLGRSEDDPPLLAHLPPLPRLETLDLLGSSVHDRDLGCLAGLRWLKSLNLIETQVTHAGLAELKPLESLEELAINFDAGQRRGLEALIALQRLKKLHIEDLYPEWLEPSWTESAEVLEKEALSRPADLNDWLRGLAALRKAKPGLAIDADAKWRESSWEALAPKCEIGGDDAIATWVREAVRAWKEKQAAN